MSALPREVGQDWSLASMRLDELATVAAIDARAYRFPWSEKIFRDCLQAGYDGWVMRDNRDVLIGYALMSMAVGEAHVLNLCIAPERQGEGLGHALMVRLMAFARARGMHVILLEVRRSNQAAIALYHGLGFQRIGLRRCYYPADGGREDAFVLAYDIR